MSELQKPTNKLNLTLKRASLKLDLKSPCRLFKSWWPSFKQYLLLEFISQEPNLAVEWKAALDKPLLIVARAPSKRYVKLIFDGRLWHRSDPQDPVCWIISFITGKLLSEKNDISQLPLLSKLQFSSSSFSPTTPLWQLLNLETPFPDPQKWQELNARTTGIAVFIFAGGSVGGDQPRPKDVRAG
jgi:hypothetical protein